MDGHGAEVAARETLADRIGRWLVANAGLDAAAWRRWCDQADGDAVPPEEIGRREGTLSQAHLHQAWSSVVGFPRLESVPRDRFAPDFLELVPISFARRWTMIGVDGDGGGLLIVTDDPFAADPIANVSRLLGRPARLALASTAEVQQAINDAYESRGNVLDRVVEEFGGDDLTSEIERLTGNEDLLDVAGKAPAIRLVNLLLLDAVKRRASDVHIQPYQDRVQVRYRVDGVLYDYVRVPRQFQDALVSRVKVMARMDIAERRLAQDGRASVEVGAKQVDLRIATLPTAYGERVVMRLLDKSARLYKLPDLGMDPETLKRFEALIETSHGIVLVTGPTGSGKTTTLYSALQRIDTTSKNVLTLEDPIEYRLPGISQTQVADRKGMTFASGLRHVLRQDPDVIMVGEIRDAETARMAVQSALTGHLVFSTLHTNDSASAVARLLDLGVEPYLAASCLIGVLAQRLVRRVCPSCAAPATLAAVEREQLGLAADADPSGVRVGCGCDRCQDTGYLDRMGIFELLTVDEAIRDCIQTRAKSSAVKDAAVAAGMGTLRQDGIAKLLAGLTTATEVLRVTQVDAV